MKTSMIQRCKFKDVSKEHVNGVDVLLNYDYMGSAEFEFGALPASLKEIAKDFDSYIRKATKFKDSKDNVVHIICKENDVDDVVNVLEILSKDDWPRTQECYLLEAARFKTALQGNDKFYDSNCWWDLENNWFACLGKSNAEKLMIGIKAFKERKGL